MTPLYLRQTALPSEVASLNHLKTGGIRQGIWCNSPLRSLNQHRDHQQQQQGDFHSRGDAGLRENRGAEHAGILGNGSDPQSEDPSMPHGTGSNGNVVRGIRHLRLGNIPFGLPPQQPLDESEEKAAFQRELHTVTVAITANVVIFIAKLVTFLYSGSSAILAETVHSVVDTFNQVLLRVGIVRSRKAPTTLHPYGYLKDKFVWSLVSAVGIFCLGAGITTAHGFISLLAGPQTLDNLGYGLTVLCVSFVVEGYSLLVATRSVLQGAAAHGLTFWQFLRRGLDPTSIAVMLEDGAAVAGLVIAGVSTGVSHVTGNSMYDAVGSIAIGLLLGCTALFLISQNRSLLIGRSMHPKDMQKVMDLLQRDSIVKAIYDAKSEEIGPGIYRFKAELEFKGERLIQRHMERLGGVERLHEQIYSAVTTQRRESLNMALMSFGNDMIGAIGAEIDRLESEIRLAVPGIRHIDLETDRGRHEKGTKSRIGLYTVESDATL